MAKCDFLTAEIGTAAGDKVPIEGTRTEENNTFSILLTDQLTAEGKISLQVVGYVTESDTAEPQIIAKSPVVSGFITQGINGVEAEADSNPNLLARIWTKIREWADKIHVHDNKELLDSITADALGNFRVIVENPAISFSGALRSDKYYIFTNPATKIAVTSLLNVGSANIIPEYIFEFTVGDTLTRLSLPKDCVWSNNDIPTIKAYKKYIIRIVGNVATYSEVSI